MVKMGNKTTQYNRLTQTVVEAGLNALVITFGVCAPVNFIVKIIFAIASSISHYSCFLESRLIFIKEKAV